jgi:hypothetical protein
MAKRKPDHRDASLVLELYDLRREAVMRESRKKIIAWRPTSWEDVVAITRPEHPDNAAYRQVGSYFEMAYGFARHGIVPADFLAENAAEGLALFAKLQPHLARFREEVSPTAFRNVEWLVKHSPVAKARLQLFQRRFGIAPPEKAGKAGKVASKD